MHKFDTSRVGYDKAGGGNYQTLINQALPEYIKTRPESLEEVVRRVVREEVRKIA